MLDNAVVKLEETLSILGPGEALPPIEEKALGEEADDEQNS